MIRLAHRLSIVPVLALPILALQILVLMALSSAGLADGPRFAVYGDMPYHAVDRDFLAGPASDRLSHSPSIAFVVAVGDLGRPGDACSDAWQAEQRALWRSGFRKPVFLTPGDNDWTDCDRSSLSAPVSELSRLDALRRIHFAVPPPGIDPAWRYRAQPGQPENATWTAGGVRFATLHLVGTANGRTEIGRDDRGVALALADARDAANRAWLAETFRTARSETAPAVVLAVHADPFVPAKGATDPPLLERCLDRPAFAPFCEALVAEAAGYPGPVLLMHGDTMPACLEPVAAADGRTLFWRLNVWGDFATAPEILTVDVDAADPYKPFEVSGLVDNRAVPDTCHY